MTPRTPLESFTVNVSSVKLEPWPLEQDQIVEGNPQVSGLVLHTSEDGKVERGIWEHTPGVSTDTESDELFVVVSGRATIEVKDGPTLQVGPGDAVLLKAGDHTTWRVHETLRKVFQVSS